jgi:hypothetical protein
MALSFVSEALLPVGATFDTVAMARGEPGLPQKFRWKDRELIVAEVLETWRDYGNCTHGSGERYLRKHGFRVRTAEGLVLRLTFQRSLGRSRPSTRWWLQGIEE